MDANNWPPSEKLDQLAVAMEEERVLLVDVSLAGKPLEYSPIHAIISNDLHMMAALLRSIGQ